MFFTKGRKILAHLMFWLGLGLSPITNMHVQMDRRPDVQEIL